jgi:ComF family protein
LQQPPAFSRTYIPLVYDYPINLLIHGFKYRGNLTYGKLLGQLLTDHIAHAQQGGDWQAPDIIIPTPMHWSKRWQRGFNQAEILGQAIAHQLNIPMQTRWVKRIHKTPAQKELTRAQRQQNLRRAFFIDEKRQAQIKGKRIALVDDVVTTTATMRELSKLLMNAGAIDVQLWCLARTL